MKNRHKFFHQIVCLIILSGFIKIKTLIIILSYKIIMLVEIHMKLNFPMIGKFVNFAIIKQEDQKQLLILS